MSSVCELWHFRIRKDDEEDPDEVKNSPQRLGVYSTEENARMAIVRSKNRPEFAGWLEGFRVYEYDLKMEQWDEGFVTEYYPDEN